MGLTEFLPLWVYLATPIVLVIAYVTSRLVGPPPTIEEIEKEIEQLSKVDLGQNKFRTGGGTEMTWDEYVHMFNALGFYSIELRKTLKHAKSIPSLYFNHINRRVSFVGRVREEQRFPPRLWDRIPPQQKKDEVPRLITIVPKPGKEREAFVDLLSGEQPGTPRAVSAAPPPKPAPDRNAQAPARKPGGTGMTRDEYIHMFNVLGFQSFTVGRLLRHPNGIPAPSLYFNNIKGRVSFAARAGQELRYPAHLWDKLPPQQRADDRPTLVTVVPESGKEWEAFCELLAG